MDEEKLKIHQLNPIIYPYKFWIVNINDLSKLDNKFLELEGEKLVFEWGEHTLAFTMNRSVIMNNKKKYIGSIIIFREGKYKPTIGIIAHECSHAIKVMFERLNIDVSIHEPFEYMLEWLVDNCNEIINK